MAMTGTLFERTLATAEIEATFADVQIVVAMLEFEAALAEAEAAEGVIPGSAAQAIVAACRGAPFDVEWIVAEARRPGKTVRVITSRPLRDLVRSSAIDYAPSPMPTIEVPE